MAASEAFQVGDRVRLSDLGESRLTRVVAKAGLVVGFGQSESRVRVLMDGRIRPVTLHKTYLVMDDHERTDQGQVDPTDTQ